MDAIFSFLEQFLGKTPKQCLAHCRQSINFKKHLQEELVLLFCSINYIYIYILYFMVVKRGAGMGEVQSVKFMCKY